MLIKINELLKVLSITIGTFMVSRYVLLEPSLEKIKQKWLYIICFGLVSLTYIISCVIEENVDETIFFNDIAQYIALFFGALNIFLGRKHRKFLGAIMVIPLIGIMDGIAAPIFVAQIILETFYGLSYNDLVMQLVFFAIYAIYALFLIVFYFKGKSWRKWFEENMKDRNTSISERVLIVFCGMVIALFSGYINFFTVNIDPVFEVQKSIAIMATFFECIAFMATIVIIVMIMQGNRRKYYHDRVANMQFSVIATMADIVEDRDSNTGGHIKRTAKYVEIIGKYLLKKNMYQDILTKQYLENMVVAAPLHDIGKISVPDAILNKPGRLTNEEYDIMKNHASAGREVLLKAEQQMGKFDYLEIAMDMAEFHHEWYDGKGYPKGIVGDEIPLCARIMAVADVFDALTSKRCYKEAMPLNKAYDIIKSESGTHFDPIVAEAFLNSKLEVEEVLNIFND